jgi:hypothetical protein
MLGLNWVLFFPKNVGDNELRRIKTVKDDDRTESLGIGSIGRPKLGQDAAYFGQGGWFRENGNGAQFVGFRGDSFNCRVAANDDDREMRVTLSDLSQHSETTETRHDEVQEDAVHRCSRKDIQSLGAIEGHHGFVPRPPDGLSQVLGHLGVVFHHQDSHDRHAV